MKLSFNVIGIGEIASIKFEQMHRQADAVETVVETVERAGLKLAGKAVHKFSTGWMRLWTHG